MQDQIQYFEKDPHQQFLKWLEEGRKSQTEPDKMTLATVDSQSKPHIRTMLFKGMVDGMFSFYTNYESNKAKDMELNPHVSLMFYWYLPLGYQVRIEGKVKKLSREQSEKYFLSRPRESRLSAWASPQSSRLENFEDLDARLNKVTKEFEGKEVTCPPNWGGYGVIADRFDFMILARYRLHDRFVYKKVGQTWDLERLAP